MSADAEGGDLEGAPTPRSYIESLSARGVSPDKRIFDLLVVVDMARELLHAWEPDRIQSIFLLTVMGRLGIGTGAILLPEEPDRARLVPSFVRGWRADEAATLAVRVGERIENRLALDPRPLPASDCLPLLSDDSRAAWTALEVSAAVPMPVGQSLLGIAALGRRLTGAPPTSAELEFLLGASSLAVLALERCRAAHRHEERAMELEVALRLAGRSAASRARRVVGARR